MPAGNQNKFPTTFDLKSLLDLVKRDTMLSINCHAVGTIQSFDPEKQTAEITVNYKQVFYGAAGTEPTLKDYPILLDCPVVTMSGGDGALTFPIAQGDTCLVLFNDRDITDWFSGGQVGPPPTPRAHSFADAFGLVGVRSMANPIDDYDADKTCLRHGDTKVRLGLKVNIENDVSSLLTVINGLISVIETIVTIPAAIGTPLTLNPASIAALEAYKIQVGELLE